MLSNGKLSSSWGNINTAKSIKTTSSNSDPIWVVNFYNPSEPNIKLQNLYVFLGKNGQYKGANNTGTYN